MYTIAVKFTCFEGKREDYINLLRKEGIVDAIRNEEGCISYEYYFSEEDNNTILLIEKWEEKSYQQKHIELSHTKKMLSVKGDYVKDTEITEFKLV